MRYLGDQMDSTGSEENPASASLSCFLGSSHARAVCTFSSPYRRVMTCLASSRRFFMSSHAGLSTASDGDKSM
ncbi:hypothetical protein PI125_g26480 [Phytophthora idaei]|nr:hypothetical protein PI125_g26480 [Phytophthora idaei]